jgi:hypothetical protein
MESSQFGSVIILPSRLACADGHNSPKMARTKPPEMEISELIAVSLDGLPHVVGHTPVRVHVE